MIVRKQTIRTNSEEVSLMASYTCADVKRAMLKYYSLIANPCGGEYARNLPIAEPSALKFFESEIFSCYPSKYAQPLAKWCFNMAVKHGFLIPSFDYIGEEKRYFLSASLAKRPGRPKENEDET